MVRLTKRRKWLLVTAGGGLVFLGAVTIAALRWNRTETYRPGEAVEGVTADLARALPADYPRVTFTDVARAAGIAYRHFDGKRHSWLPEDMGSGAAWGDFDGDGWVDLAVANEVGSIDMTAAERQASPARFVLYRNNRDGTFTDVTARSGIDFRGWGMGVSWADYDNDGHVDLLITAYGHDVLYHNNGDGTFTDVSAASGIGGPEGFWTGAAWGDYDRDGRLDLYVTGYVKFTRAKSKDAGVNGTYDVENPASINPLAFPGERNLLFHNDGNGKFSEVAAQAGVVNEKGRGLAATWLDVDDDGWPDLYVANDVSANVLYRNLGNGKFQDIGEAARVSDYRSSMGIAVGDWNGDGTQDLFLTHWLAQGNALYDNTTRRMATMRAAQPAPLGKVKSAPPPPVTYQDESDRYGLGQISLDYIGWATSFIDYDLDGRPDLFVVDGSTLQKRDDPTSMVPMQSKLFWNHGAEDGFYDVSPVSGKYFQTAYVGRGAAWADYDHDGDPDVFVVNHGGPGLLLRNDGGNRNHWLQVEVQGDGRKTNRQGIGAKVRLVAGGAAQVRIVGVQSPYLSQNELTETFGLGRLTTVDSVVVTWTDGSRAVRTGIAANQRILIAEGAAAATATPAAPAAASPASPASSASSASSASPASPASPTVDRERVQRFWVLYRQATAQRIAKQTAAAAESYGRALELDPNHEDVLYYAGSMRLALGDYSGAASAWRHLVSVNPSSARTHSQLGALHMCLDAGAPFQLDSAELHLRRAHEINREENGPLVRLGEAALLRGDLAAARRYFATVLATNAGSVPAHFYQGYLSWKAGDAARARAELVKAASAPKAPPPKAASVPGEGDTKKGTTPLEATVDRCTQLRALAEHPRPVGDVEKEMPTRYRELEAMLGSARSRRR